jgi:hypothetical protein
MTSLSHYFHCSEKASIRLRLLSTVGHKPLLPESLMWGAHLKKTMATKLSDDPTRLESLEGAFGTKMV